MRLNRKKFDNAYDRCWVSIPKSDRTFKNGMDNPDIKESILNLYRYKCNGKCTDKFRHWLEAVLRRHSDPLKAVIYEELFYHYCGKYEYEWWNGKKKVNWFDPNDKDTWQQVLDGCRPLFELFEEIG
jgi:hypothetical protein